MITRSRREEKLMSLKILIRQDGKDEPQRAAPASARYAAALAGAMIAASASLPVLSQGVQLAVVDVHAVADGYRASKLIGSSVMNDQNEKVGTIEDIIIGRDRVLFAVLQVGGFLHLGGRMVAVPYQSLVVDETGRNIKLPGATQEALKNLPEFKYAG
jgi:sporulation protein YlmC with PRC-barrel domain